MIKRRILEAFCFFVLFSSIATPINSDPSSSCSRDDFEDFKKEYSRVYVTQDEETFRFSIFCKNLQQAEEKNRLYPTAQFGVTKFSDWTREEFRKILGGIVIPAEVPHTQQEDVVYQNIPSVADWRTKGVMTPIYDQGNCGSCWAFAATENVESNWAIKGNKLTQLSMQQLVDCSHDGGDNGCNGGVIQSAFSYLMQYGQETYEDYPYVGKVQNCAYDSKKSFLKVKNWVEIQPSNETAIAAYVGIIGPVGISVDASEWSSYKGGIFPAKSCTKIFDHVVNLVGYDLDNKYWIIRNSWGNGWGDKGYMYIQYGEDSCGLAQYPFASIL